MPNASHFAARAAYYRELALQEQDAWRAENFFGISATFQQMALHMTDRNRAASAAQAKPVRFPKLPRSKDWRPWEHERAFRLFALPEIRLLKASAIRMGKTMYEYRARKVT